MSFSFVVGQINTSLERMALWYREFMHRTEQGFKALHQRILYLEDRQSWQEPSDEQVERVLQKILAERFGDAGVQKVESPHAMKDGSYFVEPPRKESAIPHAISIDVNSLQVDPNGMPSKLYAETLQMLENKLPGFPSVDLSRPAHSNRGMDPRDTKAFPTGSKRLKPASESQHHSRIWS